MRLRNPSNRALQALAVALTISGIGLAAAWLASGSSEAGSAAEAAPARDAAPQTDVPTIHINGIEGEGCNGTGLCVKVEQLPLAPEGPTVTVSLNGEPIHKITLSPCAVETRKVTTGMVDGYRTGNGVWAGLAPVAAGVVSIPGVDFQQLRVIGPDGFDVHAFGALSDANIKDRIFDAFAQWNATEPTQDQVRICTAQAEGSGR